MVDMSLVLFFVLSFFMSLYGVCVNHYFFNKNTRGLFFDSNWKKYILYFLRYWYGLIYSLIPIGLFSAYFLIAKYPQLFIEQYYMTIPHFPYSFTFFDFKGLSFLCYYLLISLMIFKILDIFYVYDFFNYTYFFKSGCGNQLIKQYYKIVLTLEMIIRFIMVFFLMPIAHASLFFYYLSMFTSRGIIIAFVVLLVSLFMFCFNYFSITENYYNIFLGRSYLAYSIEDESSKF